MVFEWDLNKAGANKRKHKISFEEAQTAFFDENALLIPDPDHSLEEERFILIGLSRQLRILTVCHCYRENDELIRIISARRAARREQEQYSEQL